jgi:hypothetical protein
MVFVGMTAGKEARERTARAVEWSGLDYEESLASSQVPGSKLKGKVWGDSNRIK